MTTDFLLKALKDNTDHLIKSFNLSLGALSHRIDGNAANIMANAAAISQQSATTAEQGNRLQRLTERVTALEKGSSGLVAAPLESRVALSPEYLLARRSVRLWPVEGMTEDDLWQGVGEFLHDTLTIREDDIGQEDIESIDRANDGRDPAVRKEVIVRFYERQKRDLVVTSSPALSSKVDRDGRPTAGVRLEIPPELGDSFRNLSRFGTRLRARHGVGTKRHIKFDDYSGSLFTNVKLPSDENWTKVMVAMARDNLAASLKEESAHTQKRMATKLVPGPQERLSRPMSDVRIVGFQQAQPQAATDGAVAGPSGKRPRWSMPDKRRPL